ncbi:MAG: acyl-CoA dehydrogenase family protein, partial [Planctomycetota bacterium]
MPPFHELDLLRVSSLFSEEEILIRDQVRQFVEDRILPVIGRHWESGTFPREWCRELGELGLLGPSVPEEFGGAGLGAVAYGLICQELERGDSGVRSFASVQGALVMYPIHAFGNEEQKRAWLPRLASGEVVGCFGLTEPDFGSNPGGMRSRCRRAGDEWVLDGRKMWITNGSMAGVSVVWAKDEEGRVQGFLVEADRKGFQAPETGHKWSLRCSVTSERVLDGVRVPEANRLPGTAGLKSALSCLSQAR